MKLLEVQNLVTEFSTQDGRLVAVDEISFGLEKGKILGLVGESGCGKSVTALSILRLVDAPGRITGGRILYYQKPVEAGWASPLKFEREQKLELASEVQAEPLEEKDPVLRGDAIDLLQTSEEELLRIRGNKIAMIFQEPMTSLNPVYTVGEQIMEAVQIHQGLPRKQAREKAIEMLRKVKIADAHRRVDDYPHQMSGGMRQRVMIAMALSCEPEILIADEPTTALDVTIQAQILELMTEMVQEMDMSMILITHDLGVVSQTCDQVIVMYAGKIVEEAPRDILFSRPKHPYTLGLMESIPKLGQGLGQKLYTIPGTVPNLMKLPSGCRFSNRCPRAVIACGESIPRINYVGQGQKVRCINY